MALLHDLGEPDGTCLDHSMKSGSCLPAAFRRARLSLLVVATAAAVFLLPASAAYAASACTVNGTPVTSTTINGTAGNDTITCTAGVNADTTINGLAGNDTITVEGLNSDIAVVHGDDGGDTIRVTGENTGKIYGDRGDDTLTVEDLSTGLVDGGPRIGAASADEEATTASLLTRQLCRRAAIGGRTAPHCEVQVRDNLPPGDG
ncbi:hypothetical protein [Streptomyces pseudovenezuelae]|uniref:Calcium-binding protein n=1 Tax=Streptomyces pseudovenezuelae TaxID=67350 RepID=A0ABT6M112_9ACTN|nr:hypothetical protein [Streptomyces pseudovenezuelae]MDH6221651.1 hypothetical protein [Streptomyces pseudovenezuelae]